MYKLLDQNTLKVTCTNDWQAFKSTIPMLYNSTEMVLSHFNFSELGELGVLYESFIQQVFNSPINSLYSADNNSSFISCRLHSQLNFLLNGDENADKEMLYYAKMLFINPVEILEVFHLRFVKLHNSRFRLEIHGSQTHVDEEVSQIIIGLLNRAETIDTLLEEL